MRKVIVAALLGAGLVPASAQRTIVSDGVRPLPHVTLHVPRSAASDAGTSWREPATAPARRSARADAGFDTHDYRGLPMPSDDVRPPRYVGPDREIGDYRARGFDVPPPGGRWVRDGDDALMVDRDGRVRDVLPDVAFDRYVDGGYDANDGFIPESRDRDYPERFERGGERDLAYDRDYPYDYPYGGEGVNGGPGVNQQGYGGYTVIETIVTTTTPGTVRPARRGEVVRRGARRRR